jgi:crossover junction endodeoxyribonuclease RuvC
MIFLGADPGTTGAIAIVSEAGFLATDDLPVHVIKTGRKTRRMLDLGALRTLLTRQRIDHVVIEQVGTRPGEGRVSAFNFGYTAGAIVGLVAGLQLPYSLVTPQLWQRAAGCGPSPDAARQTAGRLYPAAVPYLTRKRDAGRADAILIARYGIEWSAQQHRPEPAQSIVVSSVPTGRPVDALSTQQST